MRPVRGNDPEGGEVIFLSTFQCGGVGRGRGWTVVVVVGVAIRPVLQSQSPSRRLENKDGRWDEERNKDCQLENKGQGEEGERRRRKN